MSSANKQIDQLVGLTLDIEHRTQSTVTKYELLEWNFLSTNGDLAIYSGNSTINLHERTAYRVVKTFFLFFLI